MFRMGPRCHCSSTFKYKTTIVCVFWGRTGCCNQLDLFMFNESFYRHQMLSTHIVSGGSITNSWAAFLSCTSHHWLPPEWHANSSIRYEEADTFIWTMVRRWYTPAGYGNVGYQQERRPAHDDSRRNECLSRGGNMWEWLL